jgi:putative ABC transport system permease protein
MRSALSAKSWTDLTRRRGRTVLAVATLSLAVASLGFFAVAPLMDDLMAREVAANRLADLTVVTRPLPLDEGDLAALRHLPNVAAVQAHSFFATRVYVGARRERAFLLGVPDLSRQTVDVVRLASGSAPGPGAVLTEIQNARQGRFTGRRGDLVRVIAADGRVRSLRISGEGRNLNGAQDVRGDDKAVVLYASPRTIAAISGTPGYSSLSFRLVDTRRGAMERTVAAVRARLRASAPSFTGFAELPMVRPAGSWPGKQGFEDFTTFFYIVTALALLSGLVLIASTMTTLIAEQTGEIATMKAIGGRRRQIARIYLRTAVLLGALGVLVGVPLGVALANAVVAFFATNLYAIDAGLGVSWPLVAASVALGLLGPVLASLPAIRRAVRLPIRDALERSGASAPPGGRLERILLRVPGLPRTAEIGVRGVGRSGRRSLATAFIVALAVGNLLGVMALATGVTQVTRGEWADRAFQISLGSNLRRPLDATADRVIRSTPGVQRAEPGLMNDVEVAGRDGFVYGMAPQTMLRYHVAAGRWFRPAEAAARVAVVERGIASAAGIHVGGRVRVRTGTGTFAFRVVGIASNQQESGTVVFLPLATARAVLGSPDGVNHYWIRTVSDDHALTDRVTTRIEDRLTARGYEVGTEITYVGERDNVAENRTLTTSIAVLGFLVVAISMVGLVNAITMSMLERTREIGILRCIGARARDLRSIFATEGLVVAVLGWLAGIPLGYAVDRLLVWLLRELIEIEVPVTYPAANVALALVGTAALALLVMALPLRRAVRLKPGDALRYG